MSLSQHNCRHRFNIHSAIPCSLPLTCYHVSSSMVVTVQGFISVLISLLNLTSCYNRSYTNVAWKRNKDKTAYGAYIVAAYKDSHKVSVSSWQSSKRLASGEKTEVVRFTQQVLDFFQIFGSNTIEQSWRCTIIVRMCNLDWWDDGWRISCWAWVVEHSLILDGMVGLMSWLS